MTNDEKAKEIGRKWYYDNTDSNGAAYRAALQMAAWKDKQFLELLYKLHKAYSEANDYARMNAIADLIVKISGETQQDNNNEKRK